MSDILITGASRGIGRALALELARRGGHRLVLVARDQARLDEVVRNCSALGGDAVAVAGDLGSRGEARALGRALAEQVHDGATLVHNAGIWPARRTRNREGLETAFVVNYLGGLELQRPLLGKGLLRRVMVVSAGLIAVGRFDPDRTPNGDDFSRFRTYCTTKLCFAVAMRDVASEHPNIDFVVLHPGVVRTDLGAQPGWFGRLLALMKRPWESPEACARRLAVVLSRARWSAPGEAKGLMKDEERSWPRPAQDPKTQRAVRSATARYALEPDG